MAPWGWQPTAFERRLNLSEEVSKVQLSIDIAFLWLGSWRNDYRKQWRTSPQISIPNPKFNLPMLT